MPIRSLLILCIALVIWFVAISIPVLDKQQIISFYEPTPYKYKAIYSFVSVWSCLN